MVKIFSFCLFGPLNNTYYVGLLENIKLVSNHFPGWGVIVYLGNDVSEEFAQRLIKLGCSVRRTGIDGFVNTVHRFFAIDEPGVECVFVRDADSRVHMRDRWAINKFVESPESAHIIRDHPLHGMLMLAGTWGIKRGTLPKPMRQLFNEWTPVVGVTGTGKDPLGFGVDQSFLHSVIYPLIRTNVIAHYSSGMRFPTDKRSVQFPFSWSEDMYVGKKEIL